MLRDNRLYLLITAALFAATTAICSWLNIALFFTPVPINLATLSVFVAGGLLGPKYGTLSQLFYVLLGAFGLPVFSGFRGGFAVLAGPTGGFIIGYITCALIVGLISYRLATKKALVLSMILGLISCYSLGLIWFMISTGSSLWAGLVACVFPFLIGDGIKITLATILVVKLKKAIPHR